jgi:glutathione S-transferase
VRSRPTSLTEARAKFEVRPLNLGKGQQNSSEYLRINPKHKVPLLIVDGKILSEGVAIQAWIARTFPAAQLLPADPWLELQALSLMSWCSGGIHPFLARTNSPPRVCNVAGTEDSVKKLAAANLTELFKIADDILSGRHFFFDHFTAPDAHFFWCQRRARQFQLDLSSFKHCTAHFERMMQRPSVQKLLAFEKSVQDEFAKAA